MLAEVNFYSPVAAYDILLVYEQSNTIGLADNMVYDIIPTVPAATGRTTVNASVFEVECAALPQGLQAMLAGTDVTPGASAGGSTTTALTFKLDEPWRAEAIFSTACSSQPEHDYYSL